MSDRTIALYLFILLIIVIILYWLSNRISLNLQRSKRKVVVKDSNTNNSFDYEAQMNKIPSYYTNDYDNQMLSITDIIDKNNTPVNVEVKYEPVMEKQENVVKEEVVFDNKEDFYNDYVEEKNPFLMDGGSFVIGEAIEPEIVNEEVVVDEPTIDVSEEKEEIVKEESKVENKQKSSGGFSDLLIATALTIPCLNNKSVMDGNKYVNYKPMDPNKFMVGQDVSLNNSKCASFQYDLLPEWIKDLMDRENYNILVTNNEKITRKGAGLYSPLEANKDVRYMAFSGNSEQEIEESFLFGVGHFVDNYLGVLADAPKDPENEVKFFSSASREWTNIYEQNKDDLEKDNIMSPSDYFAHTFKEYITDKEKLRITDKDSFRYMNKCMKVLEFHYQKDLVENKVSNLDSFKKIEKKEKSPIIQNSLPLVENDYFDDYEQNEIKTR